jgi:hypothetical protein
LKKSLFYEEANVGSSNYLLVNQTLTPKGQSPVFGPFLKFGQAIVDAIFVQKSLLFGEHVV